MSDRPIQRSAAEVEQMPPEEISRALRAGELAEYMGLESTAETPLETEQAAPGSADQGARGIAGNQIGESDLKTMSPEAIVQARREGRLTSLGFGR